MKAQWIMADEYTKDCFNRWGYKPYQAITTCRKYNSIGVSYDLTILERDDGKFIPCHGTILMPVCKTENQAKLSAMRWFKTNSELDATK